MAKQSASTRKSGGPGKFSRWLQQKANARMNRKIRGGRGDFMGMEVLILNTVGRRSGQPRETPVAWFAGDDGAKLVVASGGGDLNPDWHANLVAHPDQASIELPGEDAVAVTPRVLAGAERERAWQVISAANPRMAKYQSKSERQYPIIRLDPR
jgi:deazaflavin-dependent oxidoreductase (nitroreductase family)